MAFTLENRSTGERFECALSQEHAIETAKRTGCICYLFYGVPGLQKVLYDPDKDIETKNAERTADRDPEEHLALFENYETRIVRGNMV